MSNYLFDKSFIYTCKYNMSFSREIQSDENNHYRVSLKCDIIEKTEALIEMHVCIVGEFTCDTTNEDLKEKLVSQNSVAILFPYLRSQVSLVSTQPDIQPILIPPVNIAAMFDEAIEK